MKVGFKPETLRTLIGERSRAALACGALQPIATDIHTIDDGSVQFQVRVVSSLARKHATDRNKAASAKPTNPFLPYEADLFVTDVSATHVCLLNKFNVIDQHVLLVTRKFEPQESALTWEDFAALWACMAEYEALGFYNSGTPAGASQPHRHLQLIPLPLGETGFPLESVLMQAAGTTKRIDRFHFQHACVRLDPAYLISAEAAARYTLPLYRQLLSSTGMATDGQVPSIMPPYNLLVSRQLMLLIPRTRAAFGSVAVNALGFAGSFVVPGQEAFEAIRAIGPMRLLREVAVAD